MKLRTTLALFIAVAGFAASYALADGGHHNNGDNKGNGHKCKHSGVWGTVSAPQTFTITVTKAGHHNNAKTGDVVTVSVGSSGQTVRLVAEGCVGTDGTLTVNNAELNVVRPHQHGDQTTSTSSNDETTSTSSNDQTTSTSSDDGNTTTTNGDH